MNEEQRDRTDADRGRRGPRPLLVPALVQAICQRWALPEPLAVADLGGSSSLNLRLDLPGRAPLVARVYRRHVTPRRLRALQRARGALVAAGLPCNLPCPTGKGRPWAALEVPAGPLLAELEPYVPHDGVMHTLPRMEQGLSLLGRMHQVWCAEAGGRAAAGEGALYANHIPAQRALAATARGVFRLRGGRRWRDEPGWRGWPPGEAIARDALALAEGLEAARRARPAAPAAAPQRVHGDFWDNNVLFEGDRLVHVADLEFMGWRARGEDLALTLWFWICDHPPAPGRATEAGTLAELRRLLAAYDAGADPPLSLEERRALPLAIARQPLWSIGGWVARLDDEQQARAHAAGTAGELRLALGILRDHRRWEQALLD
ncbi:MAG: phosphotransferase [Anaerolineae bacterium]|jgi:Ser/Thr protein kinase RdoA (MazF antagonist)|nr:phosphotransferase [Chloroflexota bacterium]